MAEKMIEYTPENRFIMRVPSNLRSVIENEFPDAEYYVENWMLVKKDGANFLRSELVRRLWSKDDASRLATYTSRLQE